MTPQEIHIRVYYEDTDAGGIVYYANYLKFAERARTEYLRALGFDQSKLAQENNLFFVVRHLEADYYKSARLDDILTVHTSLKALKNASFTMSQKIVREQTTLVSIDVQLACIDQQGKAQRIPANIREALTVTKIKN